MRSEDEIKASLERLKIIEIEEDFENWYFKAYKEALEWVLEDTDER